MPIIVDEEAVKATYERIVAMAAALEGGEYSPEAPADFAELLAAVKRALINPGGREAATLLRVLARLDAVTDASRGFVPDPDAGK